MKTEATSTRNLVIKAPNFGVAVFHIRGTAPLVVHRNSQKPAMITKYEAGKPATSKRNRDPKDLDAAYENAKYVSPEGWEGFNASAVRCAMISACRLVGFKMTLAKLSLFCIADGHDAREPQIPLVRIYGTAIRQDDIGRTSTGEILLINRPAYHDWKAKIHIRWDADQFSIEDVANLLARVGMQIGFCEGRPDSKNSAGMGWGTFEVVNE